jgi:hypothetical protein
VALAAALLLVGCASHESNDPDLQADLPDASVISGLMPSAVTGSSLERVDEPDVSSWLSARPGPVGIAKYVNGDPRQPTDGFAEVTIALYAPRDDAGAGALFQRYPPEVAHVSTALNLRDRSDEWIDQNLPSWRFALGELAGVEDSEGICLAGNIRGGSPCYAFHAWAQLCDGAAEVVYAPAVSERLDSTEVKQFLQGALREVAGARDCAH